MYIYICIYIYIYIYIYILYIYVFICICINMFIHDPHYHLTYSRRCLPFDAGRLTHARCVVLEWVCFLPMPLMAILATSWWTVVASNIFLGIQQSLVRPSPSLP